MQAMSWVCLKHGCSWLLCFGLESGQMFVFLILVSGVDLRFWQAALIVFPVCSSGAVMILIEGKWKIQKNAKEQPRCVSLLQWWRPDFRLALFVFSLLGLLAFVCSLNLFWYCILFLTFKIHLAQKSEDGHDASVYMHALYVCVRERIVYNRPCIY